MNSKGTSEFGSKYLKYYNTDKICKKGENIIYKTMIQTNLI